MKSVTVYINGNDGIKEIGFYVDKVWTTWRGNLILEQSGQLLAVFASGQWIFYRIGASVRVD